MGKGSKKSQQNQRFVSHQQNIVIIKTYVGKHQSFQSKKLLSLFKKITDQMLPAG